MSSHSQTGRSSPGIIIPANLREPLAQIAAHPHKRARRFWRAAGAGTSVLPVVRFEDVTSLCTRNLAKVRHELRGDVVELTDLGRELAEDFASAQPVQVAG